MRLYEPQYELPGWEYTETPFAVRLVIEAELSDQAIVLLINSPVYFLDWVIVALEKGQYRLVACRGDEITYDKFFDSIGEAKARFYDNYQFLAFIGEDEPMWSPPYFPLKQWMQLRLDKIAPNII